MHFKQNDRSGFLFDFEYFNPKKLFLYTACYERLLKCYEAAIINSIVLVRQNVNV